MVEQGARIGIVGCGGFALFAAPFFEELPGVTVTSFFEPDDGQAQRAAEALGASRADSVDALAGRDDVDLVYIASPPAFHHANAMAALKAGKHVITEKPMAVSLNEVDEMIALARERDLLLVTNLMQRYNPLYPQIESLIKKRLLGEPLHGFFENYARDEQLAIGHWFWKPEVSGGIFVEHSVHFFDLFAGWLGEARLEAAQHCLRAPHSIEDQVHCTLRYENDVLVDFYHGFTQPTVLDRQEMRILFERGDLRLYEWVPTHGEIHGVADQATLDALTACLDDVHIEVLDSYQGDQRIQRGRHKSFEVDCRFRLTFGGEVDKMARYGAMLRAMLEDQLAWVRDHNHARRITERNGRRSLELALQAREQSQSVSR